MMVSTVKQKKMGRYGMIFNTGVAGYHTGFYYLYSMAPEVPTMATAVD